MGDYALGSIMLVLKMNNHDLVTWLIEYAINTKICFLATWKQGAGVFSYFLNALDYSS